MDLNTTGQRDLSRPTLTVRHHCRRDHQKVNVTRRKLDQRAAHRRVRHAYVDDIQHPPVRSERTIFVAAPVPDGINRRYAGSTPRRTAAAGRTVQAPVRANRARTRPTTRCPDQLRPAPTCHSPQPAKVECPELADRERQPESSGIGAPACQLVGVNACAVISPTSRKRPGGRQHTTCDTCPHLNANGAARQPAVQTFSSGPTRETTLATSVIFSAEPP